MTKEILDRGYVTHALTNENGEIFGLIKDCYINVWKHEGNHFYWSEVYCESGYMAMVIRKGTSLVGRTDEELSELHEQSKVNLH